MTEPSADRPLRRATTASVVGLTLAMGALAGCSDDASDGGASGVDGLRSTPATDVPSSASASDDPELMTSFSDSFDDDYDHNGWGFRSSTASARVGGGEFVWDAKTFEQRLHLVAATVGEAFDEGRLDMVDVRVTASVTPRRGAATLGVFCREVIDTDAEFQWYEFVVRDGYAAIRQADFAGNVSPLVETDAAALPLGAAATLDASCVDGADGTATLSLSVDGAELLTTDVDDPLGNGGAGLQAYDAAEDQADEPMLVAWHEFAVEPAT